MDYATKEQCLFLLEKSFNNLENSKLLSIKQLDSIKKFPFIFAQKELNGFYILKALYNPLCPFQHHNKQQKTFYITTTKN